MNRRIIILFFFSLTLALGIGLVWPKYQKLVDLKQKNEEKRMEIQTKDQYFQNLKKAKEALQNYQTQLDKIDSALPSDPNVPALYDFFQKASSQQGLVLAGISPFTSRPSTEIEGLKETEFSLMFFGNYSSLKNFLSFLEKSARLFEIEEISCSTSENENLLKFNLKIKVYSY